jgi:crossover junction endodeoxyribonuclease RusA
LSKAVTFRVDGTPAPKGSTRAFVIKGRAVTTEANKHTRPWAALVKDAARESAGPSIVFARGVPVCLKAVFTLPRPASLPKRVADHTKKPDLDKLARAIKDALTGIVWQDDSQVTALVIAKRYAAAEERAGVNVSVSRTPTC